MDKIAAARELVRVAKSLMAGGLKHNSPIDQWLDDNGWTETHGIGLYTNPKFPLVGVDTNSGKAAISVYKSKSHVFNDEGALVNYTGNTNKVEKAVVEGRVIGELFSVLSGKYSGYKGFLTSSSISFFGERDDDVSFTIYTDNWAVVVGGGYKIGFREIRRKMAPNAGNIVRFIEEAQQEILAGGGSSR